MSLRSSSPTEDQLADLAQALISGLTEMTTVGKVFLSQSSETPKITSDEDTALVSDAFFRVLSPPAHTPKHSANHSAVLPRHPASP